MSDLLSVLNDKQQEAVLATEGYVRVIAGAGSGKTKLLVSRYAYLVKEYGIDSANILCVTFTNKAAGEMKKRIRALIGPEHDTTLICTYHGFCNRLLRENPEKVFLNKEYQIIDSSQQKAILGEIYQKYELKLDYASFEATLKTIAMFKSNNPDYVEKMCNPEHCQIMDNINSQDDMILEDFLQKQKATYSLDFHDLIAFAIYVLVTFPEIREKWQERLNYIMVDEFQDSSSVEMKLVDILAEQYTNLMIVGDPDQNIYEWRGSDVKLLVDFDKTHEPTNTIFLNQNYRSTPEILKCANTLIDKNELRLKKDLFTDNPHGADVVHYHSKNDFDEMDAVIKEIKKLRNQEGCSYSDFAIIYRSGFLSRIAEKKLAEKNIPYEIFGGVKFYQRMEILDIIAYLKLIAYDDDVSFRRIINTPRRKFGRSKMNALDELQTDKSLYETLKDNTLHPEIKKSNAEDFIKFIDDMRSNIHSMRIGEIVNMVTSDSGYEGYIRGLGDEERLNNLAEFKCIANEFEREFGEDITLTEFLQQIALQSGEDNDEERDAVKLMTIHASKGLEFPVVFILGFTEGIFPSAKTIEDRKQEGLEEERRLCYVAITRAQKHLYLMDSEGVSQQGIKKLCSRFLNEIGEQNYTRIGKISDDLKFESKANIDRINQRNISNIASEKKKIGDAVNHPILGDGVIEGIDDKRGTYVIKFEKFTKTRNISSSFFNEEKIIVKDSSDNTNEPEPQPITEQTFEKESRNTPNKIDNSSTNLWLHDDVPHTGWKCVGVTDLGRPVGVCEMCGYQIIRYVHHMVHPDYPGELGCGCVCAGKMEGDIEKAKKREADFKSKQKRLNTFKERQWRRSVNNNEYLKIDNHIVVIFNKYNYWKYSIDGTICLEKFHTREDAIVAAFEKLEIIRSNN